jgi:hypothetical protein
VGVNGTTGLPGNGGTGICSSITGSRLFYAGGGAGGTRTAEGTGGLSGGLGGGGGGGNSYLTIRGDAGFANTGGGGGGGSFAVSLLSGGAGGSGIVVLRYPSYLAPAEATTGSPQTYIAGPYRVYVFTSSGSITF